LTGALGQGDLSGARQREIMHQQLRAQLDQTNVVRNLSRDFKQALSETFQKFWDEKDATGYKW
jgi:hypothetical protein